MRDVKRERDIRKIALCVVCALSAALLALVSVFDHSLVGKPFSKDINTVDEWLLTDSAGNSQAISLPYTLPYGEDGLYSLEARIPHLSSPAESTMRLYSNYVNLAVYIDGELVYRFPERAPGFGGTGNTFHYIDLPYDSQYVDVRVEIACQLGRGITYLLAAPLLDSKADMFYADMRRSIPSIILACLLFIMSVCVILIKRLMSHAFEEKTDLGYFGAFMLMFSLYIALETEFAMLLVPSSRFVYMCTYLLLIVFTIPIFELFIQYMKPEYMKRARYVVLLCYVNFAAQSALHFTGVCDFRVMMPATHAIIIIGMLTLFLFMLKSGRSAMWRAVTAIPMMLGGITDIALLAFNRPSFHNNFFFIIGVTLYIIIQFNAFTRAYLRMYHASIESEILHTMAYTDMLTGLSNRNAYERMLRSLGEAEPPEDLCCIVADVNGLKQINDTHGHSAGDASLVETGEALRMLVPENGESFRTGGDEFVVLVRGMNEEEITKLGESIVKEAEKRGRERSLPLVLAIGCGQYRRDDDNIPDFIRRVDSMMYMDKQRRKEARV